jgi:gamma-glutamyltranspeptidase/glutathione hydrolase
VRPRGIVARTIRPAFASTRTITAEGLGGGGGRCGVVSVTVGGGGGGGVASLPSRSRRTRKSPTATTAPATRTKSRHGPRTSGNASGAAKLSAMQAIAAGHPATADAGAEILAEGGSAADAAVAACLASCVAETVMTGLLGGGHAIYHDGRAGRTANLDCFVAVPGLGRERRDAELLELQVPFGTELIHYAVGIASCGVPGVPAGLDALWREHGRLPWRRLVEPALHIAAAGVRMPAAHASCLEMLAPVMTMNEGARIYAPSGSLLGEGDLLHQPGLASALEAVADEGAASVYSGTIAGLLLELMEEREGLVTKADLAAYDARWSDPFELEFRGYRLRTRAGLSDLPAALTRLAPLRGRPEPERALALIEALRHESAGNGTTNLAVLDSEGSVCVLTTSLGLGSGDFLRGFDLHLNSMLGEADLVTGPLEPGERMASMMAPTIALDASGVALAAGAAGGTRLRSALLQVVAGILDEGLEPERAVDRERLHPAGDVVHLEPGFRDETIAALEAAGLEPRVWPARHHYFGGVSAVTRSGGAADRRRSGAARILP